MNKFYSYVYLDENDLPIYVGKGCGKRYSAHIERIDKHPFVAKLSKMIEDGVMSKVVFIALGVSEEMALAVEKYAINFCGRKDLGTGPLLNLTDGGDGVINRVISDATKIKLSQSSKGKPKSESHKESMRNKIVTEEMKQKYRDAWVIRKKKEKELGISRAGWKKSEESKQKMRRAKTELEKQLMREGWAKKRESHGNS